MPIAIGADDKCQENIRTISEALNTDVDSAYAMILLTATLTDYAPWDREIVEIILNSRCKAGLVTS